MDPFSQAGLGAVVAQASAQQKLGFRVVAAGAFAGAMPDLDVFIMGDYFDGLQTHRGITHSLFFAPVVGPLLGYLFYRYECRGSPELVNSNRLKFWMLAMTLAILSHPLLDVLTPYGTQLLLPFSNQRFALFAMPIIDPIYTVPLLLTVYLAWRYRDRFRVHYIGMTCLALTTSYLALAWYYGIAAKQEAIRQLDAQEISYSEVQSFPTFLQIHYRRVVARTPTEDRVGFISMWQPCTIDWQVAERADPEDFDAVRELREVAIFEWFAMGWLHETVSREDGNTIYEFSDLRYGLDANPKESFFNLNVVANEEDYDWSTGSLVANPDQVSDRFNNLFDAAYPSSCVQSLASIY